MAFAEPRTLAQLLSDNSSTIPVLDKPGAVANALLLAGHPFLLRLPSLRSRWTLSSLREELAPLWRPSPRCSGELHWERNGTVYYSLNAVERQLTGAAAAPDAKPLRTHEPCRRLLHLLESDARAVHGVVKLEQGRACPAWRRLGRAAGALRAVADAVTATALLPAHTNIRAGLGSTAYGLHYDMLDNLIAQVQGTKRLLLAPPTQYPFAYLVGERHEEALQSHTPALAKRSAEVSAANPRHSPVDWRAPDLAKYPRAASLRGVWADLQPGDVLLVPAGWLHHVAANAAPPARGEPATRARGAVRPWLSLNLNFRLLMRPRFPLFDACGAAGDAALARAPPVHREALERLGLGPVRAEYCAAAET